MIAPFWADTDLTGTGRIYYRQTKNADLLARATNELRKAFHAYQDVNVTNLLIATWDSVGYYSSGKNKVRLHNTYMYNLRYSVRT